MPVSAFQFIAVGEPRLTARLVRQSAGLAATIVLDLEDALWDLADESRTARLKGDGRRNLVNLAASDAALFAGQRIGVRVNRLSGPDAAADVEALREVARNVSLACVVAPKVESAADIAAWLTELEPLRIAPSGLVPIVETVGGVANLPALLAGARELGVERVCYGLYDHALEAGWWPMPELDSGAFWALADRFIEQVENAGLQYVQAPFFQLHQVERWMVILDRLTRTCRLPAGAITLGRQQTELAIGFEATETAPPAPLVDVAADAAQQHDMARHIVATYEANHRRNASFAVDGRSGEFISPHLYSAAQHYLGTLPIDDRDGTHPSGA